MKAETSKTQFTLLLISENSFTSCIRLKAPVILTEFSNIIRIALIAFAFIKLLILPWSWKKSTCCCFCGGGWVLLAFLVSISVGELVNITRSWEKFEPMTPPNTALELYPLSYENSSRKKNHQLHSLIRKKITFLYPRPVRTAQKQLGTGI